MSQTQINGTTQIKAGSIPWSVMNTGAIVPLASIINSGQIILSTGAVAMGAALSMGGFAVQNGGAPVNASDLATKAYVDQKSGGIGGIHEVRVVSATNLASLSAPGASIDSVSLNAGDLVLLPAQTTQSQNGPWVWNGASSAMTRPTWWTTGTTQTEGQYFLVIEGTANGETKWWMTNTASITVDTTAVTFTKDVSGGTYTAGTGLTLTAGAFAVTYGTITGTAAAGNDSRIVGAVQAGGGLGTPSSGTLTNCTGLPIAGLTGLGTGVATALADAINLNGGFLTANASNFLQTSNIPAFTGGDVTSVGGSLALSINNTAGSGYMKYTNEIVGETPGGTINGSNTAFTLGFTPSTCKSGNSSLTLFLDGLLQQSGAGNDYTISGTNITMAVAPATGDKLVANYLS